MSATKKAQSQSRDLKHRVFTCLHKLSDRDTHSSAASELESIAKNLPTSALPPFISSITATDSSDKSAVRRTCLRLISVLSDHHSDSLTPHLSKLLTAVSKRLRDPDSSVRSACVAAAFSLASNVASVPFSSLSRPFLESLFTEQENNARNCAALCLGAVIEGSRNPDVAILRRVLLRVEKLAKSDSCKSKAAVLTLMGSIVGVEGVLSGDGGRSGMIKNLVGFLSNEDWGTRKAAAEVFIRVAEMEREALAECKASCLKTFEAKKFDKVKAVRETMNRMIAAWREIPDLSDDVSPPPASQASSKENASDGRYTPGSKIFTDSGAPQLKNRSPLVNNGCKEGIAMFRKLDRKKPTDRKIEISTGGVEKIQLSKPGIKRALFNEKYENPKLGAFKNSSRVVPCVDASVMVSNETGEMCRSPREIEELSLIRKQLSQIETQQSNLLDLLQRYIGSSQNSMYSLESRVHGLELALDEISYDLAVSTGRMSRNNGATCFKLPGTGFLSSKFWRKASNRSSSTPALPTKFRTASMASLPSLSNETLETEGFPLQHQRNRFQGGRGLIMNPLARLPRAGFQGLLETSSSGVVNVVHKSA